MFRRISRVLLPSAALIGRKEQLHIGRSFSNYFYFRSETGFRTYSTAVSRNPTSDPQSSMEEYEILWDDPSNMWEQLTEMFNRQRWTSNDHATLALFPKMENMYVGFVRRKEDNKCMGGLVLIDQKDFVYGNAFVLDEEIRGAGIGWVLTSKMFRKYIKPFSSKVFILRGAPHMFSVYGKAPLNAAPLYLLLSTEFKDKQDLLNFFECPEDDRSTYLAIKDMTSAQYSKMLQYDRHVTGYDRTEFLNSYYSLPYVDGLVMLDESENIKGMVGLVPTTGEKGLYKLNPIIANNEKDASRLVHAIACRVRDPDAHFVTHFRTGSAGDWISYRAQSQKRPVRCVGGLLNATHAGFVYKERAQLDLMFAPTNSPAFFDG